MENKNMLFYDSYYNKIDDVYNIKMMNVDTGEMRVFREHKPTTEVYVLKKGLQIPSYYRETQPLSNLDVHKVSYNWREYDCARLLGNGNAFAQAVKNRSMKRSDIFLDRRLMGSDMSIENLTIMRYLDSLGYEENKDGTKNYFDLPPIRNIRKGFYDIETDIMHTDVREDQPIICSTYVDSATRTAEVYVRINPEFKGQQEIIDDEVSFKKDAKEVMIDLVNKSTLNEKAKKKLLPVYLKYIDDLKINLNWFQKEKDMIEYSWKDMMQNYKPQFLGIYNAVYDVGQTEMRADKLKIPKHKLFCHPDVGNKYYFNNKKEHPKAAFRRHDYSSEAYTKIVDTQITYFGLRPQNNLDSEAFDSVLKVECGFGKLDYSHICDHIRHLPYLDFRTYLIYNIIDTVNMDFLDIKTQDIESLLTRRFIVRTEYNNIFSPMNCVTNTFYHLERRFGYIMCNDINKYIMGPDHERLTEIDEAIAATYDILSNRLAIAGGLCSDPTLFSKICKPVLAGIHNNKYMEDVMDADAVSMYPMIIEHTNISKDSLDGRITSVRNVHGEIDIEEMVLSMITKSPLEIGRACFNLPSITRIMRELNPNLPEIKDIESEPERELDTFEIPEKYTKQAEIVRKILSSFDTTKTNQSDVKAGVHPTSKHFHINGNKSIMKINGSIYIIELLDSDMKMCEYMGLEDNQDHYIFSSKGVFFNNPTIYTKPKDVDYKSMKCVYSAPMEEKYLDRIANDKVDLIRTIYKSDDRIWKLDVTNRSHVFLNDDVNVMITDTDLFIFTHNIKTEIGTFKATILTQSLQY